MEVSVGIKVAARGLEWDVTAIEPLGAQRRVRLTCTEGDLQGLEWDVLYPAEPIEVLPSEPGPEDAGPLEAWRNYHTAWLLDQIPGAPLSPGRIAIEAYQRVPLLRALDMVRPRLLLADEPTGNLDAATGESVMNLLFGLRAAYGTTLMLITHDMALAARCDWVIRIGDGRIVT
jgi:hypothetical protein